MYIDSFIYLVIHICLSVCVPALPLHFYTLQNIQSVCSPGSSYLRQVPGPDPSGAHGRAGIYICIYICIYVYIYIYMYIYIYIYMPKPCTPTPYGTSNPFAHQVVAQLVRRLIHAYIYIYIYIYTYIYIYINK